MVDSHNYPTLENNKTYNVLNLIAAKPCTKQHISAYIQNCECVLDVVNRKGFVEKDGNKYKITEDGLDKIDLIKITYGVYYG